MKRINIKYLIVGIFLFLIIIENRLYINNELNGDSKDIYCSNIESDYEEYLEYNTYDYSLILSKVKYRDIYDYKNEFIIYKGSIDNINKGDIVVKNNSIIGIISNTYNDLSVVKLLTNKDINISIKINNSFGILKYDNKLFVDDITGNISIGDTVYTSGFGNIIPNLVVGKVSNIITNNLNKIYEIEPIIDYNTINYLYIMRNNND